MNFYFIPRQLFQIIEDHVSSIPPSELAEIRTDCEADLKKLPVAKEGVKPQGKEWISFLLGHWLFKLAFIIFSIPLTRKLIDYQEGNYEEEEEDEETSLLRELMEN